jgi:NADPH:quinone reductase-like Zn-dependent oxidoreductase
MLGAGIAAIGGPIRILTLDEPQVETEGEVVLEVHAAGVGNWDELARVGRWEIGGPPPMALGVEAAGTVAAAGGAVGPHAVGDEVLVHTLPLRRNGAWAQRVVASAAVVAPKPANVDIATAAAFPVPGLTAAQVIDDALAVERDEWLLVNGAGGVTGSLLVQLAVARGAVVIATASESNASRLLGYGAREVLDYHAEDWPDLAQEITRGEGVAKAANAARGGASIALRTVADGGRLATITGDPPDAERGVTISNVYVRPDGERLAALAKLLAEGALTVDVAAVHPLEDAARALAEAVLGRTSGAVVISLVD